LRIQVRKLCRDEFVELIRGEEMAIAGGSHCKAVGNFNPLSRQAAEHFPQGRILAADQRHVLKLNLGELPHKVSRGALHLDTSDLGNFG
jgi:hypothetical protein